MKILHTVESYLPQRHGMSEVVSQISEHIVKQGHEVIVATKFDKNRNEDIINGVRVVSFKISGNSVHGIHGEIDNYLDFLRNGDFDVITNFAAQQWATDLCLEILDELKAYKVFVPTGFSALYMRSYADYFEKMAKRIHSYDMNVFLSNKYKDIDFARKNGVKKFVIIPNGASAKEFDRPIGTSLKDSLNIGKETKVIIHVGSYTSLKGHDEALEIFLKSKYENTAILFFGHNFNDKKSIRFISKLKPFKLLLNKRILYPHYVFNALKYAWERWRTSKKNKIFLLSVSRTELIDAFLEADLLLLPSMIECSPVVLFEALASKTPFLVTDVGNSAEIINWTSGGELLPTTFDDRGYSIAHVKKSAFQLDELLNDPKKLEFLAKKGFSNWKEKFTWEVIADQYLSLYLHKSN